MTTPVKVPNFGESVKKAVIGKLLVSEGDHVDLDEDIVEFESDKASQVMPSPAEGVVAKVKVKEGQEVGSGDVILEIRDNKAEESSEEDTSEIRDDNSDESSEEDTSNDKDRSSENAARVTYKEKEVDEGKVADKKQAKSEKPTSDQSSSKPKQTKSGKVRDQKATDKQDAEEQTSEEQPTYRLSSIEKTSAQRLKSSWQEIPHVSHFDEADISALENGRENLAADERISLATYVVKALAICLAESPRFRSYWLKENETLAIKTSIDINYAVDTERGLLTPLIERVDELSLAELDETMRQLVDAAKANQLSKEQLEPGCMTVSNIGTIGGQFFTPIINSPQTAILGIGRTQKRWRLNDGNELESWQGLPLSLSYDHRAIDGARAAKFVGEIIDLLEHEEKLLIHS